LPLEIALHIFSFLDISSLGSVVCVSKNWATTSSSDFLWKEYTERETWSGTDSIKFATKELQSYIQKNQVKQLFKELRQFFPSKMVNLVKEGVLRSSADYKSQDIDCTLSNDDAFWSSKGSSKVDSSEFLVYKLRRPVCIINFVDVHVFCASFQRGKPTYAPQFIRISVGFSPEEVGMHYISPQYPVKNTRDVQRFYLEVPQIGQYVRLHLIGRQQRQPGDELWYTVLRYLEIVGIPLDSFANKPVLTSALYNMLISALEEQPEGLQKKSGPGARETIQDLFHSDIVQVPK